jgi:hypothetical protein
VVALAIAGSSAPAASAQVPQTVTGGQTKLSLNINTLFVEWGADRIGAQLIPPAFINGLTFEAFFPITGGLADPATLLGTVNMGGGIRIVQYNENYSMVTNSLETTNPRFVNGNTLTGDVMGAIPAPSADLVNTSIVVNEDGTVTFNADANLSAGTALVLNTYFSTTVFEAGQNLGHYTATIEFGPRLYPRPGSATPLRIPLVNAYQQCTSSTHTHAPPLDGPSCSPTALESSELKTGSGGKGSGFVKLVVMPGTVLPIDDADVAITANLSDVRNADNTDYEGDLILSTILKLTDQASGAMGNLSATVQNAELSAPISCVATPEDEGSACNLATTADTLVPGFVMEGKRTIASALDLVVKDAGPNGTIGAPEQCPPTCGDGDEKRFMNQGLFLP